MSVISCQTDSDCDFNFYCNDQQQCIHDGIWPPSVLDVITYALIPIIVGVGNVGGLGGGIVKVPMLMLMLNYQSKVATFISYCILFGSCLANSTLLIFKKHPLKNKPIIDYNIVLIINPMVLLGTNIGIFLNILLPEVAAGILFIVFLIIISPFMFKKGQMLYKLKKQSENCKEEEKQIEEEKDEEEIEQDADNCNGINRTNKEQVSNFSLQKLKEQSNNMDKDCVFSNEQISQSRQKLNNQKEVEEVEDLKAYNHRQQKSQIENYNSISKSKLKLSQLREKSILLDDQIVVEKCNSYYLPDDQIAKNKEKYSHNLANKSIKENLISSSNNQIDSDKNEELEEFYKEEQKLVPGKKLILLIIIFFSVQMLVFLRGGKGLKSFVGIKVCSVPYWIVNASIVIIAFAASFVIRHFLLKWESKKSELIEKYSLQAEFAGEFDCKNKVSYLKTMLAGLTAGCLAGTFGVGAGLALVPILLAAGVHPQVAAATCGFNYFFISTTTIIQVFTNSYLDIYQIILFSALSFIGGFVCAKIIYSIVEKKKASYLIVFIVFGLAVLNIISFIVYLTKKGVMYGWSSLVNQTPFCEAQ